MKRARARGATAVETMLVLGAVAIAGIGAFTAFGKDAQNAAEHQGECVKALGCQGEVAFPTDVPSSVDGAPKSAAPVTNGGGGFLQGTADFGKGFVLGAWDTVVGTYEVVRHPVDSANGIVFAVKNPGLAWDAITAEWSARSGPENAGRAAFEVVSTIGPGAIAKLGKAAAVAGKAGEAAKVAEVAAVAARNAERVRLGEGAFSVAYKEGNHVVKEIKPVVKGVGDVPTALTAAERARLAEMTAELTNEVGEHLGGGIVPKIEATGNGTLKQPYVEGLSVDDLKKRGDIDALDRAQLEMSEATSKAAKDLGIGNPYGGYLETPDGWVAQIDVNPANFRFDESGKMVSWFDPVAIFPAAKP